MANENKHLASFRAERMLDGESIVVWTKAVRDDQGFEGAAVLTNQRVAFIRKGLTSTRFEAWPLAQITSVETQRGMLWFRMVLHISGDHMTLKTADKDFGQAFADQLQRLRHDAKPKKEAAGEMSAIEQLERLASLRDAGAISDSEFATKKAELLAKI
ncbi:SHOCT domain-containing protein [Qipengyuania sp.]|uniref:SHOCT domain-containing protein n=1 Tax=Qipengyuania sp. TaxID=2004515 RepID=UPI0035C81F0B